MICVKETAATIEHYYLYDEVADPKEYVEMIHSIRNCSPHTTVMIHINTPGGCLYSAVGIVNAIRECPGTVVTCAEGEVASAGSLVFFAGQGMSVDDHSLFLIHTASGGHVGKAPDNLAGSKALSAYMKELYHDVYFPFLTKPEIKRVLDGGEMYLTSKEVIERLEKVAQQNEGDENENSGE